MIDPLVIDTGLHWIAVVLYIIATVINCYGLVFHRQKAERASYRVAVAGLCVHGAALLYRWIVSGHGPYIVKYEILSSDAWLVLFLFLIFQRMYPKIRFASLVVFPATFLLIGIGLFLNPASRKLPPSLRSIWLVFHVAFYKIALATLVIALAISIFFIIKKRKDPARLKMLPPLSDLDVYAHRFAGFGFIFWAIAMLSGSIWAYQSWGRFWGWDPIETWSLITWLGFGLYLHLRRFFGWNGERAALLFMACFALSIVSLFFVSFVDSSIHSAYFR